MSIEARATGQLLSAHTATFKDQQGDDVAYGKVQLMQKVQGTQFFQILDIKVQSDKFGLLPAAQKLIGKQVICDLDQRTYQGKTSNYLADVPKAA